MYTTIALHVPLKRIKKGQIISLSRYFVNYDSAKIMTWKKNKYFETILFPSAKREYCLPKVILVLPLEFLGYQRISLKSENAV